MFFIFLVLLVVALFLLVGYRVWLMELETRKRVLLRKSSDTALCNPYLALSATQMSKLLRQGKITSVDLVSASIKQAKRVSHLNALVCDRFDDALREAALADERLMKYEAPEKLPPFLGVPCSIKEAFSVQGSSPLPTFMRSVAKVSFWICQFWLFFSLFFIFRFWCSKFATVRIFGFISTKSESPKGCQTAEVCIHGEISSPKKMLPLWLL